MGSSASVYQENEEGQKQILNGFAKYTWSSGQSYEGEWKDGTILYDSF